MFHPHFNKTFPDKVGVGGSSPLISTKGIEWTGKFALFVFPTLHNEIVRFAEMQNIRVFLLGSESGRINSLELI